MEMPHACQTRCAQKRSWVSDKTIAFAIRLVDLNPIYGNYTFSFKLQFPYLRGPKCFVKYMGIAGKLKMLGYQEPRKRIRSSHRDWYNPHTTHSVIVRDCGSRDLERGTISSVIRQLDIERDDFDTL